MAETRRFPKKTLGTAFLLALSVGWWMNAVPLLVLLGYAAMSVFGFLAYAFDKSAATRNAWRTPEKSLHLIGLCGGWPGALFAQDLLRHKSSKPAFQQVFWVTVVLNCGLLVWLLSNGTAQAINQAVFGA